MSFLTNAMLFATASSTPDIFFELSNFIHSLKYMGIGMLVIFVVIGVIIFAINLINYLFSE